MKTKLHEHINELKKGHMTGRWDYFFIDTPKKFDRSHRVNYWILAINNLLHSRFYCVQNPDGSFGITDTHDHRRVANIVCTWEMVEFMKPIYAVIPYPARRMGMCITWTGDVESVSEWFMVSAVDRHYEIQDELRKEEW